MNEQSKRTAVALVSALGLGAGGLILGIVLANVAGIGLVLAGFDLDPTSVEFLILSLIFVQGVGCFGVSMAYVNARPSLGPKIRERLGFEPGSTPFDIGYGVPDLRDLGVIFGGYCTAFAGVIVGLLVISQLQVETGQNQLGEVAMANPGIVLYLIPVMLFVVGPSEELLFRGVVQGRLREVLSPVSAILIASIAFAGMHGVALVGGSTVGNALVLVVLLWPALVFGTSYEYTDNIVVPAVIHGIYNSTIVLFLYIGIVYGDEMAAAPQTLLAALPV
ncbi:lysostaphin resistance A-like protein [Halomicrobium sp. HM KBTZ05]|uniref:CPBP family intramembrane glutamic endopeptidase n=1 Tax=Halomicrobium sp. HM KBTZ05 TaxID=3242663 RepID=UPI003557D0B5